MQKFYFTYGSNEAFPFQGGWTEVEASDMNTACKVFQAFHPNRPGSICLNCADIYSEEEFAATKMLENGNFHKFCWERITVTYDNFFEKEIDP